jgi:putative FmdB family regulatory protein
MPIYQYICKTCGNTEERIRKVSERHMLTVCVECLAPVQRVISAPAAIKINGFSEANGYSKGKEANEQ